MREAGTESRVVVRKILLDKAKPWSIPKRWVWDAYKRLKANRGAAGVDDQSIEEFERDLKNNLCQIAPKCDPLFAAKNDPFDGAETGGAEPQIAEQSRSWRAASGRLCAVLEAPAFVASLDDVAVVCQAVKHGGGHFGVAEDLRPICESEIGGDQQRRVLIELADQVEQQLAAGLAER